MHTKKRLDFSNDQHEVLIVEQQMQGSIASRALDMEAASGSLQISADTPDASQQAIIVKAGLEATPWQHQTSVRDEPLALTLCH